MVAAAAYARSRAVATECAVAVTATTRPPATVNRRPWHHPAYDPLWAEIQRLGVPLSFHGGVVLCGSHDSSTIHLTRRSS